jgi:pimeloyl-ACP methyl ester carboxylesterase
MSKSNALENALLLLVFNATTFDGIAENDTTSPNTNLYVTLHTADPGEAGTQATNEAAYGSYDRVAVARSGAGWTVTGNTVVNAALVQFPQCTSSSETITHVGVGLGATAAAATTLLYKGALSASLAVSSGIQPQFAASALSIAED